MENNNQNSTTSTVKKYPFSEFNTRLLFNLAKDFKVSEDYDKDKATLKKILEERVDQTFDDEYMDMQLSALVFPFALMKEIDETNTAENIDYTSNNLSDSQIIALYADSGNQTNYIDTTNLKLFLEEKTNHKFSGFEIVDYYLLLKKDFTGEDLMEG